MLFVLMLVNPDDLPEFHQGRPVQRAVGLLLGVILLLEVGVAIIERTVVGRSGTATPEAVAEVGGNVEALGRTLYTTYLYPFEIASLVLSVGVIGAIVLALPERLGERVGRRRGTISLGHGRGVDYALPAGPEGETMMPGSEESERSEAASAGFSRDLIMTKDPDQYTTIGRRR
jgi:NADH-quinone oxidoreductase subunit J